MCLVSMKNVNRMLWEFNIYVISLEQPTALRGTTHTCFNFHVLSFCDYVGYVVDRMRLFSGFKMRRLILFKKIEFEQRN